VTRWSWKLGRIAGIEVSMHATFLLLLAWVGLGHYLARRRWGDALEGIAFVVALFAIVVVHELGHALTARRYGIRTRDITLLPIGGVARLERMPDEPRQELIVALVGPAVNVVLAALFFVLAPSALSPGRITEIQQMGGGFLDRLAWVNVGLAVFNLIPAFPMDGGRVLRALLAMRMDYVRATNLAAAIGRGLALILGLLGVFTNPFLVFIALFVWVGATAEAGTVRLKSALGATPVDRVMITRFETLAPADPLQRAVDRVLAGYQQDFPVVEADRVVGVLTRGDLLKGLSDRGPAAPVGAVMTARFDTADAAEMVEGAFQRLQGSACPALPVLRGGRLVGILTLDNVGEFVAMQSAAGANGKGGAHGGHGA
jgi:Zn-dependent protease/predicted transcriptional regulator